MPPEITTDAKVIPTLTSRRLAGGVDPIESFRATVASLEGSVAIGASVGGGARPALPRAARQRAGAVRRARRGRLRRRERAVRPGRGDRRATSAWTARRRPIRRTPSATRGQVVVLDAAAAGDLAGIDARRVRRHAASGRGTTTSTHAADHDARHRPRRLAALPAEGDQRGAGLVPQDVAGQDRRDTSGRRPARRSERLGPRRSAGRSGDALCATGRSGASA